MDKKQLTIRIKWILLFPILLLIPLALATTDELRFLAEQDTEIDIKEPCFNNATYCSSTATCNLTILDPNHNILINNIQMQNQNAYHNFTLNTSATNPLGVYEATVMCMDGTGNGFDTFYFKITPNGQEPSTVQGIVYVVLLFIFMILATMTILGAYHTDSSNAYEFGKLIKITWGKYVKLGLFLLSYFFLVIIFLFCEMISNNFLFLSFAEGIFHVLYLISVIGLFPLFLTIMVFMILNIMRDLYLTKLTRRNLPLKR